MTSGADETIYYKRSRFSTRLPWGRCYTSSHYWLLEEEPNLWRVGFTKFATRMLGDLVEYVFSVPPGETVEIGQAIGSVEGFKAISEVYSVAAGEFLGENPELEGDITLVDTDPYVQGWLYKVRGRPEPSSVDVYGYVAVLDATIDKMLRSRNESRERDV
jgi:glycine cleavage system H protein